MRVGETNPEDAPSSSYGLPVLVTGAGGFVGGHVARWLARQGYRVRAMTRRDPVRESSDPPIEWIRGDLGCSDDVAEAVRGMRGVVHAGGWVSLGTDRAGVSRRINVDATRALLDRCDDAGVERFVYTSSLWTTAAGTADSPADETTPWNLDAVRSPYCETKREAEQLVLSRSGPSLRTSVICPGMVVGRGDRRPGSTGLLLSMARWPIVFLPRGGIPVVDVNVLAEAHGKVLESGAAATVYIVAGGYQSYREMAQTVRRIAGRPWLVVKIPDWSEPMLGRLTGLLCRVFGDRLGEISRATVAGGFLCLHVSGARADAALDLRHRSPALSIYDALDDHRRSGRAPWLVRLRDEPEGALISRLPRSPHDRSVEIFEAPPQ